MAKGLAGMGNVRFGWSRERHECSMLYLQNFRAFLPFCLLGDTYGAFEWLKR